MGGMHGGCVCGWEHVWQGGVHGGVCGRGACKAGGLWWRGVHGRGHVWQGACMARWEACMERWGMQGRGSMVAGCAWQGACGRGYAWQGGRHVWKGGGCMHGKVGGMCGGGMHGRGACVAGETATAAGGTHPTRIHSCLYNEFLSAMWWSFTYVMRPCVLRIKKKGADYRMVIADNEVDSSCWCSPIRYNFLSKHKNLAQNSQLFQVHSWLCT